MSLKTTVGVFLSGFVVYGLVAATTGVARPHDVARPARSGLSVWLDPVASALADSGSRLKAEYLLGDDGSKDYQITLMPWIYNPNQFNVYAHPVNLYWDSARGEECAYQFAADGALRCTPTSVGQISGGTWTYLDAACTQRGVNVTPAPPGCTLDVPKYVVSYEATNPTCSSNSGYSPAHFFPIGNFVGPNQPCWYVNGSGVCTNNGTCVPLNGGGSPSGYATYAVGDEAPASAFVASTPAHDP